MSFPWDLSVREVPVLIQVASHPRLLVAPGGLMFYCRCFLFFSLFVHDISELCRPIVVKLCHTIGSWACFVVQMPNFGWLSPKKHWGGAKCAEFCAISDNSRLPCW